MQNVHNFILDQSLLHQALKRAGFQSYGELAQELGIHRNTISAYVNGLRCLPEALERILLRLKLDPGQVLRLNPLAKAGQIESRVKDILPILERLNIALPQACFVLFGSRARGTEKKYSDYDVGLFFDGDLAFSTYSRLLDMVAEWNEQSLHVVELVHLRKEEKDFLSNIAKDMIFLCGNLAAWKKLLDISTDSFRV